MSEECKALATRDDETVTLRKAFDWTTCNKNTGRIQSLEPVYL
jgi:hypothetical protein